MFKGIKVLDVQGYQGYKGIKVTFVFEIEKNL